MLIIEVPNYRLSERRYIISVILGDFLGIPYRLSVNNSNTVRITCPSADGDLNLIIEDDFFQVSDKAWLKQSSLPTTPLNRWLIPKYLKPFSQFPDELPILYGHRTQDNDWYSKINDSAFLGLDVFGSAFFMLTRYEEIVVRERDRHGRFPGRSSIAFRENFHRYPIINAYVELLWLCLRELWPHLERLPRQYSVALSHDVDFPLCGAHQPLRRVAKSAVADLVRRRNPQTALRRSLAFALRNRDLDPCNTFDWLMQTSEDLGVKSAFYFIAGDSGGDISRYDISEPWIQQLMKKIHARGHQLGLHPSYNTYLNAQQIAREFRTFHTVTNDAGIKQNTWGGRQHYLRWSAPETWLNWALAGLDYDTTLGFADEAGFRAGVCYPYRTYDAVNSRSIGLVERPLIVMEGTLLSAKYMNLTHSEALDAVRAFSLQCAVYRGEFSLLWHNNSLLNKRDRELYKACLEAAVLAGKQVIA